MVPLTCVSKFHWLVAYNYHGRVKYIWLAFSSCLFSKNSPIGNEYATHDSILSLTFGSLNKSIDEKVQYYASNVYKKKSPNRKEVWIHFANMLTSP